MISILIFKLYKGQEPDQYPSLVHTLGGCLSTFGLMQLPIFMCYAIAKAKGDTLLSVSFFNFLLCFCKRLQFSVLSIRKSKEHLRQSIAGDPNCQNGMIDMWFTCKTLRDRTHYLTRFKVVYLQKNRQGQIIIISTNKCPFSCIWVSIYLHTYYS